MTSEWHASAEGTAADGIDSGTGDRSLATCRREWEELAAVDPLWAIVTDPKRRFAGWRIDEFLRTGEQDVGHLMRSARRLGYPERYERALDFGCGVGRHTRVLAKYFGECYGVDISEKMIAQASALNSDLRNCRFVVNTKADLRILDDDYFDLIYSILVLQHLPKPQIMSYISELVRIMKSGGLLAFQLPCHISFRRRLQVRRRLYALFHTVGFSARFLYNTLGLYPIRMTFVAEEEVAAFLDTLGAKLMEIQANWYAGPSIQNRLYYVTK